MYSSSFNIGICSLNGPMPRGNSKEQIYILHNMHGGTIAYIFYTQKVARALVLQLQFHSNV